MIFAKRNTTVSLVVFATFVLLFCLSGAQKLAAQGFSNLNLYTEDGQIFSYSLDGAEYSEARAEHQIEELLPGEHKLEIKIGDKRVLKEKMNLDGGQTSVYRIATANRKDPLQFVESRSLGQPPAPPAMDSAALPNLGKAKRGKLYTGRTGCPIAMDSNRFARVLLQVYQPQNDGGRLDAARRAVENQCLSVDQVVEISRIFQGDPARFEWAQFAYRFTFDQEYFMDVGETFSFASTREQLQYFLEQQPK